ncbi:hypothetical protein CLU79DRAFT_750538 [Phycomyces nitens]|nr:hypothetical protein CLU79DRAFT_750538 [Phycomyces nitens]
MQTMSFYSLKFSSIGMLVFPLGHFECQYVHHLELLPLLFLGASFASYALDFLQLYGRRQSFVLFTIFLHVIFCDCN